MVKSGTKVQHVLVELPMYMRHEVIQSHSVLLTIVAVLTCDPSIEVFPADPDGTMADTHDRHIPNQRRRVATGGKSRCSGNESAICEPWKGLVRFMTRSA